MNFENAALRRESRRAVELAGAQGRRTALVYAAVAAGAGVLCTLVSLALTVQSESMTGLSGRGGRSAMLAVQMMLTILLALLSPLWNAGYSAAALDLSRHGEVTPRRLLWGFGQWKRLLICGLLLMLQGLALMYLAMMLVSVVYVMTPLSAGITAADLEALTISGNLFSGRTLPLTILSMAAMVAVAAFLFYRYRLVFFLMADHPEIPGIQLLRMSAGLIRGYKGGFFRLDLGFWWYYLLLALAQAAAYWDIFLEMAGVPVPLSATARTVLCAVLNGGLLVAVQYFFKNRVYATYAGAYNLLAAERLKPRPEPEPANPWRQ